VFKSSRLFIAGWFSTTTTKLRHWRQLRCDAAVTLGCPHRHRTGHRHVIGVAVIAVAIALRRGLIEEDARAIAYSCRCFRGLRGYKPYSAGRLLSFLHPNPISRGGFSCCRVGSTGARCRGLGPRPPAVKVGLLPTSAHRLQSSPSSARTRPIGTLLVIALSSLLVAGLRLPAVPRTRFNHSIASGITT